MSAICLGDVTHRTLRVLLGNRCFGKGLLAISAADASRVKTVTNTIDFCIDGQFGTALAPTDNIDFADTTVQPVATTCFYSVCVNAAGTPSIVNGEPVSTAAITAGTAVAKFPEVADTLCVIGGIKVITDATHTFTPGTTELSAAGITDEYFNFSCIPTAGKA